ncbi:hypothetical protein ACI68E_003552 [Malassezia pachydermatis]|uniref:COX assembly mitochondrial protein n=1 Tax=Malassezia pachydermatis TaxID=77020 RepID=A0A0M8MTG4_9BASI|nr:hypothetical protein Malapachy_0078 [Malassezia pachydermatis]KOS13440.1 hypothetical protein Malapachy_0078 [Malassezia pachydermatis]
MSSTSQQVLSNREYDTLVKEKRLEAYKKCDPIVQEFVACTKEYMLSVGWACKEQSQKMRECLHQYMNPESLLEAEKEYLRTHRKLARTS